MKVEVSICADFLFFLWTDEVLIFKLTGDFLIFRGQMKC